MPEERLQRRLAAILSADVVGYSRLMGLDEAGTLSRLNALRRELIDPTIAAHFGRIVKLMGDGALVEFASAVDAVTCAIEIQRRLREHHAGSSEVNPIQFRIGINVGDIIIEGGDILGDGVNIAARIEGIAEPGGISISEDTWRQVQGKVAANFVDAGEQTLKNITRPLRVYRLDQAPAAATAAPRSMPAQSDKPSIAVLAFNNMSGDPEQEYFSDGISEDIITDLSKLSELRVIARNSTFTYKGKPVDVKQIGRELGAGYVLEGSVRKAGNRVRVTGQLIDAASGAHVWADRFDRDLTDIFAVQDELTQEIIAALKLKLTSAQKGRLVRKTVIDVEAYNLFLRGREQALLQTKSSNAEARALLERAIAISPDFAAAYAYIAFTRLNDYIIGTGDAAEQSLQTSLKLAMRAVAMDDEDPYGHFVLSVVSIWRREYETARAEVQRCLALAPSSAEGHLQLANLHYYEGDPSGALDTLKAYMRLDPLYPGLALHFVAQAQHSLGQFEAAVETLKRRLERDPKSETGYALLASCYGHLGQIDESRSAWAEVMRIAPDFSVERRWGILPFKNPASYAHRVEGLRKAGLPV
jgi:TolB-like protein/Tfp pilus assembly protein PilF